MILNKILFILLQEKLFKRTIENQGQNQIKAIKEHGKQLDESKDLSKNVIMIMKKIAHPFLNKNKCFINSLIFFLFWLPKHLCFLR